MKQRRNYGLFTHQAIDVSRARAARVRQLGPALLQLVEPRHTFAIAHDEQPQRASLPAARVFRQPRAVWCGLGEGAQVFLDVLRSGDCLAVFVPEHLFDRGSLRVVLRAGRELRDRPKGLSAGGGRNEESDGESSCAHPQSLTKTVKMVTGTIYVTVTGTIYVTIMGILCPKWLELLRI